jgi:hypothetical protein
MKLRTKLAMALGVLSLGFLPTMAGAVSYVPDYQPDKPPKGNPDKPPNGNPDKPSQGSAPKGKAYGFFCKGQSKKHVKGEKGTAFSRCVKAMAQADKNENLNAKKACKALSKKHVKGQQGTPFSQCVKGVNQMRKEKAAAVASGSTA